MQSFPAWQIDHRIRWLYVADPPLATHAPKKPAQRSPDRIYLHGLTITDGTSRTPVSQSASHQSKVRSRRPGDVLYPEQMRWHRGDESLWMQTYMADSPTVRQAVS